jgi:hypothetical protein
MISAGWSPAVPEVGSPAMATAQTLPDPFLRDRMVARLKAAGFDHPVKSTGC